MDYKNPMIKEINPEPLLEIHEFDAQKRDIRNGDLVVVHNERGNIKVKAKVTRGIKQGVVALQQGWSIEEGCANMLTSDRVTDFGDGSTYFTCLVEVTKVE
jgi:anaerobic selenocysteine-containing dehydrogenase